MKWTSEEETQIKQILELHKNLSYEEIAEIARNDGVSRTSRSIAHKNQRDWRIERKNPKGKQRQQIDH